MTLQFEVPQSNRFSLMFLGAVILALALWPVVERTIDRLMPHAATHGIANEKSGEGSAWDLRAMWD